MRAAPSFLAVLASVIALAVGDARAGDTIFDFDNVPEVDLNPRPTPPAEAKPMPPDKTSQTKPSKPPVDPSGVAETPPAKPVNPKMIPAIDFKKLRAPVPAADALAAANKSVHATLGEKIAAAKTSFDHRLLANELASLASTEKPAERYALLVEAYREALATAQTELADRAWQNLADAFEVQPSLRIDLLSEVARLASPELAMSAANQFLHLAQAVKPDQLDTVAPLLTAAENAAARSQQKWFENRIRAATAEIRLRQAEAVRAKLALVTLEKSPSDPAANTTAGRFYGPTRGDWERALPYLAKSSDLLLKAAADAESKPPETADEQFAAGEAWSKLTDRQTGAAQRNLAARALYWYQRAEPNLTGLSKPRVAAAIARVTPFSRENYAPAGGGIVARFAGHPGASKAAVGGYRSGLLSLTFSSDERYLASLGREGVCKIWDLAGLCLSSELGATDGSIAFAPNANRLLVPMVSPGTWVFYDYQARKAVARFTTARSISSGAYSAPTFSPNGSRLVVPSSGALDVVEGATGNRIAHLDDAPYIDKITFSPDGASFATFSFDKVILWETDTLHRRATSNAGGWTVHFKGNQLLGLVTPSGRYDTAFGDFLFTASIRDFGTNQPVCTLRTNFHFFGNVVSAFSPDGKLLAIADFCESGVLVADTSTGAEVARLAIPTSLAASAATMPAVRGLRTGQPATINNIEALAFSPSGKYLAAGSSDGAVTVFAIPAK